ncbi:MAG: sarcosine oxidase subunit alpha family protein [Hyphomicrobiaceae bacterium]
MSHSYRLPKVGRIDRSTTIVMQFNGREIPCFPGDTVASALLANGISLVGRSFKYHRPRGIVTAGSDEPNALLDINRGDRRRDPNNRATVVEAFDGLSVRSQNHWPSLTLDIAEINNLLSPIFSAGFYYKTFMWPPSFWNSVYEPLIRRVAGLGHAPRVADPDRYVHQYAHCDVLVVGSGPAGLAAATRAAATRQRVILCDEQNEFGGSLLHDASSDINGRPAAAWLKDTIEGLAGKQNVKLLTRTTAFGYYNDNHIALCERLTDHLRKPARGLARERLWHIRANHVVLATGAHERPLVFANNDRPGIMLADSMRCYLNRYGVASGRDIVIATNGASAYHAALDMARSGVRVQIVDSRRASDCGPELEAVRSAGVEVRSEFQPVDARGRLHVSALVIAPTTDSKGGTQEVLRCDSVGLSGGWTPAVHLASQARARLNYNETIGAFIPSRSSSTAEPKRSYAGSCGGVYDLEGCLKSGLAVVSDGVHDATTMEASPTYCGFALKLHEPAYAGKAFVDLQNDVTNKDILLALREGFESVEHVKRYTTTGMATDQGKTSNMNALGIAANHLGKSLPELGTTTFRPPYTPVTFGTFAGQNRAELFDPVRVTPTYDWAVKNGAIFEDVGLWKRAHYFPGLDETMANAVRRECVAVRKNVGVLDASTLGKIEVVGRDAAQFLNMIYTGTFSTLAPGRCRYGIMLKEDGYVFDDGVVARLAQDRFHITTTTGGAPRVLAHMEDYLQTEFPGLEVYLTSTTEQWAVVAVQGPFAQQTIADLVEDIDLDDNAFPNMSVALGRFGGVPCRLFRVSFTGEIGYEINVPSDYGAAAWQAVLSSGEKYGITPYGTETMHVLRAEKGFIIVGQETDGTVTPGDLGLGGLIAKKKADFIGKRSLDRPDLVASDRKQLVGILTRDPKLVLDEGAHLVNDQNQPIPMTGLGHITSSYFSANCDGSIALALVVRGRECHGQTLFATTADGFAEVRVVAPRFI